MTLKRHIPNFITCLNLLFGCMAVVFALRGEIIYAVAMIFVATLFDFLDGLAARLLKAYSAIGKELDSLADVVSFGLAPAAIMHDGFTQTLSSKINWGLDSIPWELVSFFPFIFVVAAALRLAKFNVDTRQSEHFRGLPTPAAALLICSLFMFVSGTPKITPVFDTIYTIPVIALMVSWLMVSNLPMISLKVKALTWKGNQIRFILLALSGIYITLAFISGWPWSLTMLLIMFSYLLLSLFLWVSPPANPAGNKEAGAGGTQTGNR